METLTYSSGRASGWDSPGLLNLERSNLVPKSHFRRQRGEAGIGAERFHPWLHHQPRQTDTLFTQSLLHPTVGFIHFTERGMESRYLVGTDIPALTEVVSFGELG